MACPSNGRAEPAEDAPSTSRLRAARRTLAIAGWLGFCLPMHWLSRAGGDASPWPRHFLGTLARLAGVDAEIVGRPLDRDVLLVSNHLSWLDIPMLAGACGARFVSKEEVRGWPLIGYLAGLNRTVYVARTARARVADQAGALRAALADGAPVALFPEGGTGDGRTMRPFRAALLAALSPPPPGVRVQPVAIDYHDAGPLMAWNGGTGFAAEMARLLGLAGRRRVTLRFLDPIDPADLPDRKALAEAARGRIAAALGGAAAAPL